MREAHNSDIRKYAYREKNKNIPAWLCGVYLEDSSDGGMKVIGFGLGCIMDIDRVATTGD
jgi:hypothetical protein